jgi:hypothetical protein
MADDFIDLRSVNWSQGMFLTPEHFLRGERYVDSRLLWMMRYLSAAAGIVGGGPRVDASERGAARFDPIVQFDDSGDALTVSVTQCRGITGGGSLIEVDPSAPLSASFSRKELEGTLDVGIYVVGRPHDKVVDASVEDPINPQVQTGRRMAYRISLDPSADDIPWSLLLTRLRRADRGLRFERAAGFIPACALMSGHSELMHAFRQLNERVATLADHYGALHRAIVEFLMLARARAINIDQDLETLTFVSRMVMTLEECAYRILDPTQPPRQFFQQMTQLIRSAALFLSLSPPTREYFRLLGDIGETEFVSMLEAETEALEMGRHWSVHEDLGPEVTKLGRALARLDRLEQALEGKYMDYRVSPSLESINFVFDRTAGDAVLYKAVAKPTRPQAHGQELTFVFAPLRLEAREQYRVVLVGDRQAAFNAGDSVTAELRINPGEGYTHRPEFHTTPYEIDAQRNFAVDFSAPPDVVTINDLRVSLRSSQPIRSAILYVRARLMTSGARLAAAPAPAVVPRPQERWPAEVGPAIERPAPRVPSRDDPGPVAPSPSGRKTRLR